MLSEAEYKKMLIIQYDSMIVKEFDRVFKGLRVTGRVGVGVKEIDSSSCSTPKNRQTSF